jgi:hypothetical protein
MTDFNRLRQAWIKEPMLMKHAFWPDVDFYDKQVEIIHSVRDNVETYVPAGNMLGKDFVCGFIVLWFFLTHYNSDPSRNWVRIVTTSVKEDHLGVLWAEVAGFIHKSRVPLICQHGGPLSMVSKEIRHKDELATTGNNVRNYVKGMVSAKGEGLQGHHAQNTLLIIDEASGVDDDVYNMGMTWAKRALIIGNPHPCVNFFYRGVKAGDMVA